MRVRVLVCAIAMLGMAAPAAAGERHGHAAVPDVLSLLLQDDHATFGSPTPSAVRTDPLPDTLTRFEALMVPASPLALASEISVTADLPVLDRHPLRETSVPFDARRAIADVMADYPRPFRRRDILDTMVTFRLDGEQRTRSLSVGGVAGAVWSMMPRR
jgi:hypothetical protein